MGSRSLSTAVANHPEQSRKLSWRPVSVALALMTAAVLFGSSPAGALLQPGFDQQLLAQVAGQTRAWGLAAADFNGDGTDDLISGDTAGDVHLYTGNGDGTFTDRGVKINMPFHDAYAIAAADFNDDGDQDFALSCTAAYGTTIVDGGVYVYLGNGDGTFQSVGFPQVGIFAGDAGTDVMAVAAADVDGDDDVDLVAGDVSASENARADVLLFLNTGNDLSGRPVFGSPAAIISAPNVSPNPEAPPYYPPTSYLHAYGLAFADVDGDLDWDLLVSDRASYLYVYANDGHGSFLPVRYDSIGTRPYAYARFHEIFASHMALATGDLNGDGLPDVVAGGTDGAWEGQVDLWLHAGLDGSGRATFTGAGVIGASGTDARGLAVGQLNPAADSSADIAFGSYEGRILGLFADLQDTDGDGIIDRYDNAPLIANYPRLDINTDGSLNRFDQLDNDDDGTGDPADDDDDNDGVLDTVDLCPFTADPAQADADGDWRGDACDPLDDRDTDADGVPDAPLDPSLKVRAVEAKALWSRSDTHFVVRVDALGRVFQNEFVQTFVDAAILNPADWEAKKLENYNGIGDDPADPGYQIPMSLPGGMEVPISVAFIPKQIWNAFGDPDPIRWTNDRNAARTLEIAQHGTYHVDNTPLGDWAGVPDRWYYASETCGFTEAEMYQLLRVGRRTLLGDYTDPWIRQSGADPAASPRIDWSDAANPLIAYSPPYNTSDTASRAAVADLGFPSFSASIWEESSLIFAPEGSSHETFDLFGIFHASADRQVNPVAPAGMAYPEYLDTITQYGGLNTWLIEEVEWSTRYCNDVERLEPCSSAPGGVNRENNMVDPARWEMWLQLLDFVRSRGVPMTLGDYALAMAYDNAPTVSNPAQSDSDHDGIGDAVDDAALSVADVIAEAQPGGSDVLLSVLLTGAAGPIADQVIVFRLDTDADGTEETFATTTGLDGVAALVVRVALEPGMMIAYSATWDGIIVSASGSASIHGVDTTPPTITSVSASPNLLWPPNHKMVRVLVAAQASDAWDPSPQCTISSVRSNEPVDGTGDGDTSPDWIVVDDLRLLLRAERSGIGTGRTYWIRVDCTDLSGNTAWEKTAVTVPLRAPIPMPGDGTGRRGPLRRIPSRSGA